MWQLIISLSQQKQQQLIRYDYTKKNRSESKQTNRAEGQTNERTDG